MLVGAWVMVDATKRGMGRLGAFLWGQGTLLMVCMGLPMWLLFRGPISGMEPPRVRTVKLRHGGYEQGDQEHCPAGGARISPEDVECPSCRISFLQFLDAPPPTA